MNRQSKTFHHRGHRGHREKHIIVNCAAGAAVNDKKVFLCDLCVLCGE